MKKLSLILASAMLLLAAQACSDDKDKSESCDSLKFEQSCDGSLIKFCQTETSGGTSGIVATAEFLCHDGDVAACENGKVVMKSSLCNKGDVLYCDKDKNEIARDSCETLQCEEYLKGDIHSADCFDPSLIKEGCGDVTAIGSCSNDNQLTFCSKKQGGKLLTISCTSRSSQCMHIEEGYGFDCAIECKRDNDESTYNDFGTCDGAILRYCTQNKKYAESDCSSLQKTCGFGGNYYQCI